MRHQAAAAVPPRVRQRRVLLVPHCMDLLLVLRRWLYPALTEEVGG